MRVFKTANVGSVDRIVRLLIGAVLIALPYAGEAQIWANPAFRWGIPAIGAILVITALLRFCPLYRLIGANTCKTS